MCVCVCPCVVKQPNLYLHFWYCTLSQDFQSPWDWIESRNHLLIYWVNGKRSYPVDWPHPWKLPSQFNPSIFCFPVGILFLMCVIQRQWKYYWRVYWIFYISDICVILMILKTFSRFLYLFTFPVAAPGCPRIRVWWLPADLHWDPLPNHCCGRWRAPRKGLLRLPLCVLDNELWMLFHEWWAIITKESKECSKANSRFS